MSHGNVLVGKGPLSITSVTLVLLLIPCVVVTIFRALHLLNVDALSLGIRIDVSEGESWSVSRGTSFEALGTLGLFA